MSTFARWIDEALYGPARIPPPDQAKIKAHVRKIKEAEAKQGAPRLVQETPQVKGLDLPAILDRRRGELVTAVNTRKAIEAEQRRAKLEYEFEAARLDEALRQTETVIASQIAAIDVLAGPGSRGPELQDADDYSDLDNELAAAMEVSGRAEFLELDADSVEDDEKTFGQLAQDDADNNRAV